MVKVLQVNIQSLNKNFNFYINNNEIDICILSEIFDFNTNLKNFNFNIIHKSRNDGYGGVAIVIKNNIHFRKVNFNTD